MKPTAAPAHFPYNHRTVEQVDRDERLAEHQRKQVGRVCGHPREAAHEGWGGTR